MAMNLFINPNQHIFKDFIEFIATLNKLLPIWEKALNPVSRFIPVSYTFIGFNCETLHLDFLQVMIQKAVIVLAIILAIAGGLMLANPTRRATGGKCSNCIINIPGGGLVTNPASPISPVNPLFGA